MPSSGSMLEEILGIIYRPIIQRLEALMADVQQVLADVRSFKTELSSRLDSIDDVIERLRGQVAQGQIDQAALDELQAEVTSARSSLEAVNPEDPSGDDIPPATPTGDG